MEGTSDADNMADKRQTEKEHISNSPLFTKLPPELRLKIYEEIFEGSKTTYKRSLVVGQHTYHNIFSPSDHRNFLLTCLQAYNEALEMYWSKTILYGDRDDDEPIHFLQSVVPGIAKLHIKHIRDLRISYLDSDLRESPVRGCLEEFQSLQTIGASVAWFWNATGPEDQHNPPTIQEEAERLLRLETDVFNRFVYDGGPAVISRLCVRLVVPEGRRLVETGDRTVKFHLLSSRVN